MLISRKRVRGRGNSRCQSPEIRARVECWRNVEEARVTAVEEIIRKQQD